MLFRSISVGLSICDWLMASSCRFVIIGWSWCGKSPSCPLFRTPPLPFIRCALFPFCDPATSFAVPEFRRCSSDDSLSDELCSIRDSIGDLSPDDAAVGDFWPSPDAAAAAAAACCARSFLDAFPRFLRSRIYSQPRLNSKA